MGTVRLRLLCALCIFFWLSSSHISDAISSCKDSASLYVYAPATQRACCYYGWVFSSLMAGADTTSSFYDQQYCGKETQFSKAAADYANFTSGSTMYNICGSYNCSSAGLTETKRCCVYNDTVSANVTSDDTAPFFQVPSISAYLCPYSDTPTKAFGFNLPAAPLPAHSTPAASSATNPVTKAALSKCPSFSAAAGNYTPTGNASATPTSSMAVQTFTIPVSSGGSGLAPETPYALLIQRKAAVQQLTITLSMYVDGDPASILYDREVLTLYPSTGAPPKSRRRGLLADDAASSQWMHSGVLSSEEWMEVQLAASGRQLMKGSSGGGGGGGKGGGGGGGGGKSSGGGGKTGGSSKPGTTATTSGGSGASLSGGKTSSGSYKAVKAKDLVKGGTYASTRSKSVGVNYYGNVLRSRYKYKGRQYRYNSSPARPLAFGLPLFFAAWFLTAPLAMWYGYSAWSLFQSAHSFNYVSPSNWVDLPSGFTNYTCPAAAGASPIGIPVNGSDCLTPFSQTCCGQPYQNAKFTPMYSLPGYVYKGAKLTCPLRSDLVMEYPVFLPQDARTLQLVIHSMEAILAPNTTSSPCGGVAQVLDPQEPPLYVSFLKVEGVSTSGAGGRAVGVPLAAALAMGLAWLAVLV